MTWPDAVARCAEGLSSLGVGIRCWQAPDASGLWLAHVEERLSWRKRGDVTP